MKKKIFCFVNINDDLKRLARQRKELFDELSKRFKKIYILNLINLRIFEKKKFFNKSSSRENFNKNIEIINFKTIKEFLDFAIEKKIILIMNGLTKSPSDFLIFYLLKKINASLIMIFDVGAYGTPIFYKTKPKFLLKSFKHFYEKGFYYIWRFLTIINFFPKIELLLECNKKNIEAFNNGLSRKFEKKFPCMRVSLYRDIKRINSSVYDLYLKSNSKKVQIRDKYIVYADTPIDHYDRVSKEGRVSDEDIYNYYKNTSLYLDKISNIYNKKILITIHPNKMKEINKYSDIFSNSNYIITPKRTGDVIMKAEIFIFCSSSAILNAIIAKKKIISFKSIYLGDSFLKLQSFYEKVLKLPTIQIDIDKPLNKSLLDKEMNTSLNFYDKFIYDRLIYNRKESSSKQISDKIFEKFFI